MNDVAPSNEDPRREKLQRIIDLGHDPYGQRFDNRDLIGDLQKRTDEIHYLTEAGEKIALPTDEQLGEKSFREWLKEQDKGTMVGPTVRAAGRILLHRDKGKLQFIDIEDWTGKLQLFVGQNQVVDGNWDLIQCLDLGDLIGVDGVLRRTMTGELSLIHI